MDAKQYIDNLKWDSQSGTVPLIRETGLETPVFRAFAARAEWEILSLVDDLSKTIKEEYSLCPAGQQGIGLDWYKLNERIWIPLDFLEATSIGESSRAIFEHDEMNFMRKSEPEDKDISRKVIYGPGEGSSEEKIEALAQNQEWQKMAKTYSLKLLEYCLLFGKKYYVNEDHLPILEALVNTYRKEMV